MKLDALRFEQEIICFKNQSSLKRQSVLEVLLKPSACFGYRWTKVPVESFDLMD